MAARASVLTRRSLEALKKNQKPVSILETFVRLIIENADPSAKKAWTTFERDRPGRGEGICNADPAHS